jgi:hypothetical protein
LPSDVLGSICPNAPWNPTSSSGPIGYLLRGGPSSEISDLNVVACNGPESIQLIASGVTTPGTFSANATIFTDAKTLNSQVIVTKLGPVGDTIEGNFHLVLAPKSPDGALTLINGDFQVCHVPDEEAP